MTFKFIDKRLQAIISKIETSNINRIQYMNEISDEIRTLEALLKKWNLPDYLTINAPEFPLQLSWCPVDKRLMFQIAVDSKKPLIEMPFNIREMVYKEGHLSTFFEKILQKYA
jgi:hypothetical protein